MTSDPDDPGRWPRDSKQENDAVHQATEGDRLKTWIGEQKLKPLADALGVPPGNPEGTESWAGQVITPEWWDDVAEPAAPCPWCQRPGVPAPCPECRQGHAADTDPPSLWSWWAKLSPAWRRLHIAARFGTDPWSSRRVVIYREWTDTGPEGTDADPELADPDTDTEWWISAGRHRYTGCTPDGIYWKATAAH